MSVAEILRVVHMLMRIQVRLLLHDDLSKKKKAGAEKIPQ